MVELGRKKNPARHSSREREPRTTAKAIGNDGPLSIEFGAQTERQTSEANDREQQDEVASSEARVTRLAIRQCLAFGNAEMARFRHV